jgi:hypothetical protein
MGVYYSIESIINEMVFEIARNQTIMKYLVYDDVRSDPILKPDVEDTQKFIYRSSIAPSPENNFRIFPIPKMPYILEEKQSCILCWFKTGSPVNDDIYYSDFTFVFDIVSHIDIWQVDGGIIRPLRILDEINNIFFLKETQSSIGKLTPLDPQYMVYDSRGLYCGYRLAFEGTDFTKSLCVGS